MQSRLAVFVMLWFAGSAVSNTSAKVILTRMPLPLYLCCVQFAVACLLGALYYAVRPQLRRKPESYDAHIALRNLALAYTIGFVFVNAGFVAVNVSLAETLRSAEPVFSVAFAKLWLRDQASEKISNVTLFSLVPIVLGGAFASGGDATFSLSGFIFTGISNASFAMRSIVAKQLKLVFREGDGTNVFFSISLLGLRWLLILTGLVELSLIVMAPVEIQNKYCAIRVLQTVSQEELWSSLVPLIIINALTYNLYNLMSFLVLELVSVVSHAVANSMRRVVTIAVSIWVMKNTINFVNAAGMCLAVAGLVIYSLSRAHDDVKPLPTKLV